MIDQNKFFGLNLKSAVFLLHNVKEVLSDKILYKFVFNYLVLTLIYYMASDLL